MTDSPVIKPPYSVPTMTEIRGMPWNGFNAVSTFSGCGGSSTGYRMAGFRVLWANEFVSAAQDSYRANKAGYTALDGRSIRDVSAEDILSSTGLSIGEIDVFDGSPPCDPFSLAGPRDQSWGKIKKRGERSQRTDDLFFEYSRLISGTQPRVFIAENVAGLVKGSAKGYFKMILADLKSCGYKVTARVVNAAWLGVPQTRNRVIFIGVRNDLAGTPVFPKPLPYQYSVRDVLPHLAMQGGFGGFGGFGGGADPLRATERPSPTITTYPQGGNYECPPGFVVPFHVVHDTGRSWSSFSKGDVTDRTSPTITSVNSACFALSSDRPMTLDPETGASLNVAGYASGRALIEKVGSRFGEPRKLTLAELRAICGFPQDFILTGSYAQRWERLGMAVPPVMMACIATAVRDGVLTPLRAAGTI